MKEKFEMVAKTLQGLEGVLASELKELGAEKVEIGKRMVAFEGDTAMLYRANFCCRTALRILKPFYKFHAGNADELYQAVRKFDWDKVMKVNHTFSIDSTVYSDDFRHSKFVTYRVKDAIVDFFSEKYGKRPSIRLTNADFIFDVHISDTEITLSLDSSGDSLHKRGYRVAQTDAPINEVLAAGIILMSGWHGESDFVDPMCGSGTFLIEAAMIARNIYPGVYRNSYAFERWTDFNSELFDSIYNDDSAEREFTHKIYGSDISPKAIAIARANVKNAALTKDIVLEVKPIEEITQAPEGGILITNPPYGERLEVENLEELYHTIGSQLKKVFQGYHAWIIGYHDELFACIGLKPSVKYGLLNGQLECELREYVVFNGTFSEFRKEGRTVKNDEFHELTAVPEYKHRRFETTFKEEGRRGRGAQRSDRKISSGDRPRGDRRRWFDRSDHPKNALEEKYRRKPYGDSDHSSAPEGKVRNNSEENNTGERDHSDEFANRVVRFRQPRLSPDSERPIVKGRRNGWRRRDLDEDAGNGSDNGNGNVADEGNEK